MVANITQFGLPINPAFRNIVSCIASVFGNDDIGDRCDRAKMLYAWTDSVLDRGRFGDTTDRVLFLHGDLAADDATYPETDEIAALGIDVFALAICLQRGFITPKSVGELVEHVQTEAMSAVDFNTAIGALIALRRVVREASVDDVDFGALSEHGADINAVDECLHRGVLSAGQIIDLLDGLDDGRLTTGEFDTAVAAFHEDGIGAQQHC